MKRILIITNHLKDFAGSEILVIELAEALLKIGYQIDFYTLIFDFPLKEEEIFRYSKVFLVGDENPPNPFEYDMVWSQHQLISPLFYRYIDSYNISTIFIFVHLSPYHPLESRGMFSELLLSNLTIVNSQETADKMIQLGIKSNTIFNMKNAAPIGFYRKNSIMINESPNTILVISNHIPLELNEAIDILLSLGKKVTIYGLGGKFSRILPSDFENVDAVITIGKSVQYSLLSGIPVFNYDHFGGSGWITSNNYKNLERFNYSGRDSVNKLSPIEIVNSLLSDYSIVKKDVKVLQEYAINNYNLDTLLDVLINQKYIYKNRQVALTDKDKCNIIAEASISTLISDGYYAMLNSIPFLHREIQNKDQEIQNKDQEIQNKDQEIQNKDKIIYDILHSKKYRLISMVVNIVFFWKR